MLSSWMLLVLAVDASQPCPATPPDLALVVPEGLSRGLRVAGLRGAFTDRAAPFAVLVGDDDVLVVQGLTPGRGELELRHAAGATTVHVRVVRPEATPLAVLCPECLALPCGGATQLKLRGDSVVFTGTPASLEELLAVRALAAGRPRFRLELSVPTVLVERLTGVLNLALFRAGCDERVNLNGGAHLSGSPRPSPRALALVADGLRTLQLLLHPSD